MVIKKLVRMSLGNSHMADQCVLYGKIDLTLLLEK